MKKKNVILKLTRFKLIRKKITYLSTINKSYMRILNYIFKQNFNLKYTYKTDCFECTGIEWKFIKANLLLLKNCYIINGIVLKIADAMKKLVQ